MDHARLSALRLEAERLLRHELQTRFPDLAAAFDVRLADRPSSGGSDAGIVPSEHIDW